MNCMKKEFTYGKYIQIVIFVLCVQWKHYSARLCLGQLFVCEVGEAMSCVEKFYKEGPQDALPAFRKYKRKEENKLESDTREYALHLFPTVNRLCTQLMNMLKIPKMLQPYSSNAWADVSVRPAVCISTHCSVTILTPTNSTHNEPFFTDHLPSKGFARRY